MFCSDDQGELYAFCADDGRQRWKFTGGTSVGRPWVSGGVVYVADGSGNMNALDAASGRVRWRFETGEQDVGRAATGDGMVCFTAKSDVIGLEAATGRVRWRGTVGGEVRGDLVRFTFDHVGMFVRDRGDGTVETIEGNTGTSGAVSDSATGGDGVYRKIRSKGLVRDYVHVTR